MFTTAIVSLALAASAFANVFLTSPVSSTTFTAGQNSTVSWQDNNVSPSLAQFGLANFYIAVGNSKQQSPLQLIGTYINVSSIHSFSFIPDKTIGPSSNEYFIRVVSLSANDSTGYPEEAFSALFSLSGMSGTFNSSIQAEINGQSTAPIGGSTASAPSATGMPMSTTGSMTTPKTSAPAGTATSTSANAAAKPVLATGLVALITTIVGASFL